MSKDRHEQVGALFLQVRELPSEDRAGFLDQACADDAALRAEVESLLEGEAAAPNLTGALRIPTGSQDHRNINAQPSAPWETIETPAVSMAVERPDRVGPYKILEQIGEGGMGTVYVAEQTAPIRRRVALKIIKLGMDTRQVIARFEAERQALAMMNHPNIARALDAGATETGRPFFVMELVRGIPITDYCDQERLDTRSRLELFTHVCEAIQHAHHKGIVHRDIKPSNVMVTLQDGVPVPKVIDFGVAKATNAELTQKTLFTERGQLIGTPEYMSPEQAEMSGLDIDTRSDIYSLGVLLYVLLTGTTPFSIRELRQGGFSELQHIIRTQEPRKPSTRLGELPSDTEATAASGMSAAGAPSLRTTTIDEIAHQRRVNPHTLRKQLRGDLDWIVLKALEKDRSRRYDTANGLAADIKRHLNHEPVIASPPSAGYRARKFLRRNRAPVVAVASVILALAIGLIFALRARASEARQRQLAQNLALKAQAAREEAEDQRTLAEDLANAEREAREDADAARAESDARYAQIVRLADIKRLVDAEAAAEDLWPAHPEKISAIQTWLAEQAGPLRDRLELHRGSLSSLRAGALPYDEQQQSDIRDLESVVATRRRWRFPGSEEQWHHDKLAQLVAGLDVFTDPDPKKGTLANVEQRLAFAETIEQRSISGPEAAAAWSQARADVALLEAYGGLDLKPQLGLMPLRRDARSGLWEFWHVQTGERPQDNLDDDALNPWKLTGDTGLVFVLVPGGTFWMGAQKDDPEGSNYDPGAERNESPVHEVTLDPFFVSKYEMTQGQWERFTGSNPSYYLPGFKAGANTHGLTGPVEEVDWSQCLRIMQRLDLTLPTEAQWEYAARAGTNTPWWSGVDVKTIQGHGNFAALEDGYGPHAPAGSFSANAFGLHDTLGNVFEWCRDGHGSYEKSVAKGHGERRAKGARLRVFRGGSFSTPAAAARSANRSRAMPTRRRGFLGLRPARVITE
ncbi:MAG: bifunctional serine/threonine-protein kinase/formylglycine-generating enzyme family protein [Planctomycetota bacterium]|nr:bifunctional serine/threonine-protein kinase/formylglycine-generating enzyme family protein [Planctomycetota bacterium]